eukprot:SAG11_NODE_17238_length_524_cov_1.087059_1_plen_156_part_00
MPLLLFSQVSVDNMNVPTVQWEILAPNYVMDERTRNGHLRVTSHVHEHAVACAEPTLIHADEWLVAVNKPAGVCSIGGGRGLSLGRTSVLELMPHLFPHLSPRHGQVNTTKFGKCSLAPAHRLDKPVSGVLCARPPACPRPGFQLHDMSATCEPV